VNRFADNIAPAAGTDMIERRKFLSLLGTAVVASPLAARSHQGTMHVIGFLSSVSPGPAARPVMAFRQGLQETGFVGGQNLAIEYRWAEGHNDRLPQLVADLIQQHVAVIVATGGGASALAAKAATATIPIVFSCATDPVELGLVSSLNRPGGNLTGVYVMTNSLESKRLGFLKELASDATTIGVLVNPNTPGAETQLMEVKEATHSLGRNVQIVKASSEQEIDNAFADFARLRVGSLLVAADPFFYAHREQLVARAAQYSLPTIYEFREYVAGGGLISYGISLDDAYKQIGIYTGRILKGAKPHELPVMQPTKFELVINLSTARTLGINIPATLLASAEEVIE
jgi:ABC-type uncharacterized transport system substrate-binding protein